MFDIGWSELLVIAVVALIAIGPKELPGVLRNVGHWMGKVRRMAAEFQSQFQEAMREAEMEDLKKHADDLNNAARSLTRPLDPTDYLGKLDAPSSGSATGTASASNPENVTAVPETAPANTPTTEAPAAKPAELPVADARPTNERDTAVPTSGAGGGST